jgi:hypothetical protein
MIEDCHRRSRSGFGRSKMTVEYYSVIVMRVLVLALTMVCCSIHALELKGIWQPGGMIIGRTDPGAVVYFEQTPVLLTAGGYFVIGLGREAAGSVKLSVSMGGEEKIYVYPVIPREYEVQRVDGVPERTVTPPEDMLTRIREEAALVNKARSSTDLREDFLGGFVKPLDGQITGVYGSQRIYNGVPKNPHYGLDIARPEGTLVAAPAAGVVKLVHKDMYYSGGTLIIDHGYGVSSTFIHLSDILVDEGTRVMGGQLVARVGATGRATGPHLDWRMNWLDVRLDPALALKYFPGQYAIVGQEK